jgi:hypothetical protein
VKSRWTSRDEELKKYSNRLYVEVDMSMFLINLLEGVDSVDSPAIMGACLGRRMGLEAA